MDSYGQLKRAQENEQFSARVCPTCGSSFSNANMCPNDGTLLANADTSSKELVKQYEINSIIASGGMGVVYKARHLALNQTVAIKMLRTDQLDSKKIDRFKQEASALSSLDHENVVKVRDFGMTEHNQPYMVLDFIEGKSLADLIKQQGYLRPDAAIRLAGQIADALSHAHNAGIIHRDLKPSNVMVSINDDRSLHAKIIDFGIARILQDGQESALTRTGEVLGSPQYMSPEQVNGEKLDARSDIYSLGCVIFEMLTGRPPFVGASSIDVATQHLNQPVPRMADISVTAFPDALEEIVATCLQKNRELRFQSMSELQTKLSKLFQKNERAPEVVTRKDKRHEILLSRIGIGTVLAIIVVCAGLLLYQQQQKLNEERERIRKQAQSTYENKEKLQKKFSEGADDLVRQNIKKTIAAGKPGQMSMFATEEFCSDAALDEFGNGKALIAVAGLDRTDIKGPGLAYLIRHPLVLLSLNESSIADRAGLEIRRMPNLKELQVDNCNITDAFFRMISHTKLRRLSARIDRVGDQEMKSIAEITTLHHLQLAKNRITNRGYEELLKLPELQNLEIQENFLDLKSAYFISKIQNLEEINAGSSNLNDEQLALICKAPKLHVVTVDSTPITSRGLNSIGHLKRLTLLNVSDKMKFSDDDFKFLQKFPMLEHLYIAHTSVTNKVLDYIGSKTLFSLDVAKTQINDTGLKKLDKFSVLRQLDVEEEQFSEPALESFRLAHPACKIHKKQKSSSPAEYFK